MDRIVLEALSVVETMAIQLVTVRPTLFLRDHFFEDTFGDAVRGFIRAIAVLALATVAPGEP